MKEPKAEAKTWAIVICGVMPDGITDDMLATWIFGQVSTSALLQLCQRTQVVGGYPDEDAHALCVRLAQLPTPSKLTVL